MPTRRRDDRLGPRGHHRLPARRARPGRSPGPRPTPWSPSCAPAPTGPRPAWSASSPAWSPSERTAPVLVVDRPGWIQANADGFADVIGPLIDKLQAKRGAPGAVAEAVGSQGHRPRGRRPARLHVLEGARPVRPVLRRTRPDGDRRPPVGCCWSRRTSCTSRASSASTRTDFRLWVCLHEETHRVQFTAVPWMRDHIHGEIENLVGGVDLDPAGWPRCSARASAGSATWSAARTTSACSTCSPRPQQREVMDRITAVMSLLEGHADVVMDGVGPEVIPTRRRDPREVQPAPQGRRHARPGAPPAARPRRRRWRSTATAPPSCARVVDKVGMDGFNAVWAEPANLPVQGRDRRPGAPGSRRVHG